MPGIDAFFDPEPRLELMKEMGIDRTLLWPTLASVLEERVADDPDVAVAVIHALNEWMHEHWTYDYSDAIYSTPIISLAAGVDRAIEELEWVQERGARIFLIRVAPVPTWKGRKSFALPEFDPFWERVQELDLVVGMHSGDSGYTRYTQRVGGPRRPGDRASRAGARRAAPAFRALSSEKDNLVDAMASIIGHGLATRFPKLRFMPVEFAVELDPAVLREAAARVRHARRCCSTRTRWRSSTATSRCTSSTSRTRRASSTSGSPSTTSCSAPTSRTPRAWPTRSPTTRWSQDLPMEQQALIMGGSIEKATEGREVRLSAHGHTSYSARHDG